MDPATILQWALNKFGRRITLACGFNAFEGMAILDMAVAIDPGIRVFTLDTGKLHAETYALIERCEAHYGITVDVFRPDPEKVLAMERECGPGEFYKQSLELRWRCCQVRKVSQLPRALAGYDAWIAGIHNGQTVHRSNVQAVEHDTLHGGIVKVNPFAHATREMAIEYVRTRGVPYHPLLDQGFGSLACACCTRALRPGEGDHDGKWYWEPKGRGQECGLHAAKPLS